jgi:hypothetical protein
MICQIKIDLFFDVLPIKVNPIRKNMYKVYFVCLVSFVCVCVCACVCVRARLRAFVRAHVCRIFSFISDIAFLQYSDRSPCLLQCNFLITSKFIFGSVC